MTRARKPVRHWPADVPRTGRVLLDAGHGSFCIRRLAVEDDEEANDPRPVELRGCLLLHVRRGKAILARDGYEVLLLTGDAAVVSPGRFTLTGLARPPVTHYEHELVFFNDRVLADVLDGQEDLRRLALINSAPDLGIFPARNFGRHLATLRHHGVSFFPTGFIRAMRLTLWKWAYLLAFLKHHHLIPRGHAPILPEHWAENLDNSISDGSKHGSTDAVFVGSHSELTAVV